MKKFLIFCATLLLLLILTVTVLLRWADSKNKNYIPMDKVTGQMYETEALQVLIPDGWEVLPNTASAPDSVTIIEGPVESDKMFYKPEAANPNITISIDSAASEPPQMEPVLDEEASALPASAYREVVDIPPLQIGDRIWQGQEGTLAEIGPRSKMYDYGRIAILWALEGEIRIEANITLTHGNATDWNKQLSLEDGEVLAILNSISLNPQAS